MPESSASKKQRFFFNCFPCYRASGAKVLYIADDFRQVKIQIGLNWLTKNYVGTIFGGSMFAATDPMYMIMLIKNLGDDFIVWDKGASIKFLKPGKSDLYATFVLSDADLAEVRAGLVKSRKLEKTFAVDLVDREGTIYATIERLVYIRHKPKK